MTRRGHTDDRGEFWPRQLKGHKLTLEWSGEYGVESSSTAHCKCGWQESASNQSECRWEYHNHLKSEHERLQRAKGEIE